MDAGGRSVAGQAATGINRTVSGAEASCSPVGMGVHAGSHGCMGGAKHLSLSLVLCLTVSLLGCAPAANTPQESDAASAQSSSLDEKVETESNPSTGGGSTGGARSGRHASADIPKLYQVLYDNSLETTGPLAQTVRLRLWIRYMGLSEAQVSLLKTLATRFQTRKAALLVEQESILTPYAQALEPLLQQLNEGLKSGLATEDDLAKLAQDISSLQLSQRREEQLQTARIKALRAVLSDAREFLNTLDPEQEERMVTCLFLLRNEVDPFANPGTYRELVGPSWNAGDFSSLLNKKDRKDSHLNVGGLWDIDPETAAQFDYANIERPILMFYLLKEPGLLDALNQVQP